MKRVTLNIDLEDNKLFEKEVAEYILSFSRQVAKETIEKEVSAEIQRIACGMVNPCNIWLRDKVHESVKKILAEQSICAIIDNLVSETIQTKVHHIADREIQKVNIKKIFDDKLFASIREYFTGGNDGTAV